VSAPAQFSGAFTIELTVDKLADLIAERVLARLHAAARDATSGSSGWTYHRDPDPDPGAGPRTPAGARYGAVIDDGAPPVEWEPGA
jgi:hypothetical protein